MTKRWRIDEDERLIAAGGAEAVEQDAKDLTPPSGLLGKLIEYRGICQCGCSCGHSTNKLLCWPCFAEIKDIGAVAHLDKQEMFRGLR